MSDRFVVSQNIERFRRLLANGCGDGARAVLTELLAAEEAKLASLGETPEGDQAAAHKAS
jgi:hypothetical protein